MFALHQEDLRKGRKSCSNDDVLCILQIQRHDRFTAFVDHLCRTLGIGIILGSLGSETGGEENLPNEVVGGSKEFCESCRIWLAVELLCTWEWPGGNALIQVLPYLWSFARSRDGSCESSLLWGTIRALFVGSSNSNVSKAGGVSVPISAAVDNYRTVSEEPFLRALLSLLQGLLEKEDGWSIFDARVLFRLYVTQQEAADFVSPICAVQILPQVLAVLMPSLRKRGTGSDDADKDDEWQSFLQTAVSLWVQKAMTGPPLVALDSDSQISGIPPIPIIFYFR